MIASIAPSAAPLETPSVSGVASGLRSSAWKTTPAAASAPPTSAAASTRGSRAMKKICASTLSANGIERSKTRASEMCVAADERRQHQHAASAAARRTPASVERQPASGSAGSVVTRAADRDDRQVTGARDGAATSASTP